MSSMRWPSGRMVRGICFIFFLLPWLAPRFAKNAHGGLPMRVTGWTGQFVVRADVFSEQVIHEFLSLKGWCVRKTLTHTLLAFTYCRCKTELFQGDTCNLQPKSSDFELQNILLQFDSRMVLPIQKQPLIYKIK